MPELMRSTDENSRSGGNSGGKDRSAARSGKAAATSDGSFLVFVPMLLR